MIKFHWFWLCCFLCCNLFDAKAQTDGLAFHSHEVVQDNRTGLSFGEDKPICFHDPLELSFDLSFLPQQTNYFGYIVRLINSQDINIDILYDYDPKFGDKHFRLIIGETYSNISFNIPGMGTSSDWHTLKLRLDPAEQSITLTRDNEVYKEKVKLPAKNCYSIFFGANDFKTFKNADVPPMKIRNIRLAEGERQRFNWPLNERAGNAANEAQGRLTGKVINPIWIAKMHHNWQPLQQLALKGPASTAFDAKNGILYLVTRDSLFSYNLASNKVNAVAYINGSQDISSTYQSVFHAPSRQIFTFSKDLQRLAALSVDSGKWNKQLSPPDRSSGFGHFNKFLWGDSLLYTFNGYGYFLYKNEVYSANLVHPAGQVDSGTSNITPRYLAAAGADRNGVYLLGGYGNASGKQVLNPKNLYDLDYYDARTNTYRKIYELKQEGEEFVFANSMIIDSAEQSWYALSFPKHRFNSSLQLVKGSLHQPVTTEVGDKIPYLFQDVDSYADLFYCPSLQRFLAVTLYSPGAHASTMARLYSIYSPPFPERSSQPPFKKVDRRWLSAIGILTGLMAIGLLLKGSTPASAPVKKTEETAPPVAEAPRGNSIFLFGEFQVNDAGGENITRLFTPLLRELCLIILVHSIKYERGISAEKLKEMLWFDKTPESARNNLAVNIAKLKGLLDKLQGCELSKETGYWKINIHPPGYVDYLAYQEARQSGRAPDPNQVSKLVSILQRGSFLPGDEHDWLDTFKSESSNDITDYFLAYARQADIKEDAALIIKLADCLYVFDPVNEELLRLKCKALVSLGKHSLAKTTYELFVKEYFKLYAEAYQADFQQVIS